MQSRKKSSTKNIMTGLVSKIIVFVFAFLCRTVFVRMLGAEYTGVNGLFTNILSILALADLGIGNVFAFSLYEKMARSEREEIAGLIYVFRKIYIKIGLIILIIGIMFIPLLPIFVNSELPSDKIVLYYILSLLNTVSSYFFVYKSTILIADQKQYINNIWTTVSQCVMYSLQVLYLILLKDFTGFLVIQIVCTVGKNLILSLIADRKYPYIRNHIISDEGAGESRGTLWNNIKASFVYKICNIALSNTDNVLISIVLGTIVVGYYSNYYLLIQYVSAYIYIITSGLHASVGNYQVTNDRNDSYVLFKRINILYSMIGCVVISVFISCIQQFVHLWLGEQYVLSWMCVIAIMLNLYIDICFSPITLYRETLGFFKQAKYILVPAAIINLVLSVVLGNIIGLPGILFATSISKLVTCVWYEPCIIFKHFQKKVSKYFLVQLRSLFATSFAVFLSYFACSWLGDSIVDIVIRALLSLVISVIIAIFFNYRSEEFRNLVMMVKTVFRKKVSKDGEI